MRLFIDIFFLIRDIGYKRYCVPSHTKVFISYSMIYSIILTLFSTVIFFPFHFFHDFFRIAKIQYFVKFPQVFPSNILFFCSKILFRMLHDVKWSCLNSLLLPVTVSYSFPVLYDFDSCEYYRLCFWRIFLKWNFFDVFLMTKLRWYVFWKEDHRSKVNEMLKSHSITVNLSFYVWQ